MGGTKGGRGWEIQESWPEALLTRRPCRTGAGDWVLPWAPSGSEDLGREGPQS